MWPAYIAHRMLTVREEEPTNPDEPSGHVTSISVIRPYRRLGLANRLMKQSRESMFPAARPCEDMMGTGSGGPGRRWMQPRLVWPGCRRAMSSAGGAVLYCDLCIESDQIQAEAIAAVAVPCQAKAGCWGRPG